MARVNEHYLKLKSSYLFSEIARRVREFQDAHPDARIIRLGIGDVTQPLPSSVIRALHEAVDEMARAETFRGYGPEPGYEFLTALIAKHDYGTRGVSIAPDEIFVSDGGKTDGANIQEIFAADSVIAVTDPVYPVYLDSNVMAGRTGAPDDSGRYARRRLSAVHGRERLRAAAARSSRRPRLSLLPQQPDRRHADQARAGPLGGLGAQDRRRHHVRRGLRLVHPRGRGAALDLRDRRRARGRDRAPLATPRARGSPAPAARTPSCPRRRPPARSRASASASTVCGSAGSPPSSTASPTSSRRAPPPSTPTKDSRRSARWSTTTWRTPASSARAWRRPVSPCTAGRNAPYIWLRTPRGLSSWDFFDKLLNEAHVVGTPGLGLRALRRRLLPADRLRLARANPGSDRAHQDSARALVSARLSDPEARRGPLGVRRPRARRRRSVCRLHTPRCACQR